MYQEKSGNPAEETLVRDEKVRKKTKKYIHKNRVLGKHNTYIFN
jgi:hypothetical protein